MSVRDDLGARMKIFYEQIPKTKLMRRTPVIIRIDGKAFHTFTRGFKRPFDVFCKCFLAKVAKYFWRMLHLQIGESCKASTGSCPASRIAIADQI